MFSISSVAIVPTVSALSRQCDLLEVTNRIQLSSILGKHYYLSEDVQIVDLFLWKIDSRSLQ